MSKRQHPSARRKPQSANEQDDAFVAGVIDFSEWARQHRQMLTLLVITGVILVAGGLYYVNFQRTLRIQAVNLLEEIHQTIAISATEDAKAQLSSYLESFEGTDQAREAVIILGRLHLESGDAPVAISVLERADLGFRDPIGVQGNSLLARAYENQGRWPEAEDTFLEVADRAELDFQIRGALDSAARVRRRQQDYIGAAELYERIIATFEENDPARGLYQLRLAEMREIQS
ncbi:MAG TPA: tetratricopeptide repeat protein [Gemmatimonadetes bacterium]|nr:tetratricopeptide repeat protein [Gemmatimonadota bacterium]